MHPNDKEIVTAHRNLLVRHWIIDTCTSKREIKAHDSPVLCMDYDPTGTLVATGSSDRTVKVWDIEKGYCTHNFRGHRGILTSLSFHPDPERLELMSCGEDATVRVWQLTSHKCVAVLQDHLSAVTSVSFSVDGRSMLSTGRDKVLNIWDLADYSLKKTVPVYESLESGRILPASFVPQSLLKNKRAVDSIVFATVGENGVVRLWQYWQQEGMASSDRSSHKCECILQSSASGGSNSNVAGEKGGGGEDSPAQPNPQFTKLLVKPGDQQLIAVTSDHNFLFLDRHLRERGLIVGYNDEVIDICYIPRPSVPSFASASADSSSSSSSSSTLPTSIAVATNSEQVRVFDTRTFHCALLRGHADIVVALDASKDGRWLATASKDNTARIWDVSGTYDDSDDAGAATAPAATAAAAKAPACAAVCVGHTEAVGAVCFSVHLPSIHSGKAFLITGSRDKTLKRWDLGNLGDDSSDTGSAAPLQLQTVANQRAHEKDINALAISPTNALLASASQDKTVRLWATGADGSGTALALQGACRGHKRGVWAVDFSPVDKCLVSSSADQTVKVWSARDCSCLQTFEGHTASVLTVRFVSGGIQLLSGGGDGLIKLWTVRGNKCENTIEAHQDKVWAIACRGDDEQFITGGGDSVIGVWGDATEEVEAAALAEKEGALLQEQELMNCMYQHEYSRAIPLALELEQPLRLLGIFQQLVQDKDGDKSDDGGGLVARVMQGLSPEQLTQVLGYVRVWNTSARNSLVAQAVLHSVLRFVPTQTLKKCGGIADLIDGLVAYSERHFQRIDHLVQQSFLVDHSLKCMQMLMPVPDHEGEHDTDHTAPSKRQRTGE